MSEKPPPRSPKASKTPRVSPVLLTAAQKKERAVRKAARKKEAERVKRAKEAAAINLAAQKARQRAAEAESHLSVTSSPPVRENLPRETSHTGQQFESAGQLEAAPEVHEFEDFEENEPDPLGSFQFSHISSPSNQAQESVLPIPPHPLDAPEPDGRSFTELYNSAFDHVRHEDEEKLFREKFPVLCDALSPQSVRLMFQDFLSMPESARRKFVSTHGVKQLWTTGQRTSSLAGGFESGQTTQGLEPTDMLVMERPSGNCKWKLEDIRPTETYALLDSTVAAHEAMRTGSYPTMKKASLGSIVKLLEELGLKTLLMPSIDTLAVRVGRPLDHVTKLFATKVLPQLGSSQLASASLLTAMLDFSQSLANELGKVFSTPVTKERVELIDKLLQAIQMTAATCHDLTYANHRFLLDTQKAIISKAVGMPKHYQPPGAEPDRSIHDSQDFAHIQLHQEQSQALKQSVLGKRRGGGQTYGYGASGGRGSFFKRGRGSFRGRGRVHFPSYNQNSRGRQTSQPFRGRGGRNRGSTTSY